MVQFEASNLELELVPSNEVALEATVEKISLSDHLNPTKYNCLTNKKVICVFPPLLTPQKELLTVQICLNYNSMTICGVVSAENKTWETSCKHDQHSCIIMQNIESEIELPILGKKK